MERRRVGDTPVLHYQAKPGRPRVASNPLLLILLRVIRYNHFMAQETGRSRADIDADGRGGDSSQSMDVKRATSDQAPGEETVQVSDRYSGGGPPPEPAQSEHGQHQTGG